MSRQNKSVDHTVRAQSAYPVSEPLCDADAMKANSSISMVSGDTHSAGDNRYTRVAALLHWAIAALFAINFLTGFFRYSFGPEWVRTIMGIHKPTGLLILVLTLVQIAWRAGHRPPPFPAAPKWQVTAAKSTHMLLYMLMLALPLTGWAMASATPVSRPLSLYGLFPLPFLPLPKSAALDGLFNSLHASLGIIALVAVALHVAAALKHQFMDRDRLIYRMMP